MAKYIALYNCPLCGAQFTTGSPTEVPEDMLPNLLARVVTQQRFLGSPLCNAPMHIPHKCKDGGAGLAYFIGFSKIG